MADDDTERIYDRLDSISKLIEKHDIRLTTIENAGLVIVVVCVFFISAVGLYIYLK